MEQHEALVLARQLLVEHGLKEWRAYLDYARQRCGACHFRDKQISLSRHFVRLNNAAEVRATILHEIAHALAGPRAGHGRHWQQIAARIGAPHTTTNDSAHMPEPPWGLRCQTCSQIVARRHRRSLSLERVRCKHCGIEEGILGWVKLG